MSPDENSFEKKAPNKIAPLDVVFYPKPKRAISVCRLKVSYLAFSSKPNRPRTPGPSNANTYTRVLYYISVSWLLLWREHVLPVGEIPPYLSACKAANPPFKAPPSLISLSSAFPIGVPPCRSLSSSLTVAWVSLPRYNPKKDFCSSLSPLPPFSPAGREECSSCVLKSPG